jgi:hypothetical protein
MAERGEVLVEAIKTINGIRQDQYGSPEDSFQVIATYWSNYLGKRLGKNLSSKDVALMMVLFKIAREQNQGKRDNLVDAAGYLGIAGDMKEGLKK